MTTPLKRDTLTVAQEAVPVRTSASCPTCHIDRPTFRDKIGKTYFVRHMQAGRGCWCANSGKEVKS